MDRLHWQSQNYKTKWSPSLDDGVIVVVLHHLDALNGNYEKKNESKNCPCGPICKWSPDSTPSHQYNSIASRYIHYVMLIYNEWTFIQFSRECEITNQHFIMWYSHLDVINNLKHRHEMLHEMLQLFSGVVCFASENSLLSKELCNEAHLPYYPVIFQRAI